MENMEAAGGAPMAAPEQEAPEGYQIVITVDGQGAMTVATAESEPVPAANIKEALTAALSIYKANGKPDPMADQQAGFDEAVGDPAMEKDPGDHEYRG